MAQRYKIAEKAVMIYAGIVMIFVMGSLHWDGMKKGSKAEQSRTFEYSSNIGIINAQ